jgi:type IV pilus assembly protein PilE
MSWSRGFTLVEMLVVLLIVAILSSLAWPGYSGYLTKTRRMEGKVALLGALQRQEQHHALHHTYVAFSQAEPVEGLPWWSGSGAATSFYELDAEACPGSDLRDCVRLRARPGTASVDARFTDPECGTLTLDSRGAQGANGTSNRCWP